MGICKYCNIEEEGNSGRKNKEKHHPAVREGVGICIDFGCCCCSRGEVGFVLIIR